MRFLHGRPVVPLGYVQSKNAQHKRKSINKYTVKGREQIHKNLAIDTATMLWLMRNPVKGRTIEYADNRISLYAAQYGKCAVTGIPMDSHDIHCHHKVPVSSGGSDEYANLILVSKVHYDLTLPEALETYEKIPSEHMHGLKCVGFDLKDGSDYEGMQSLMIEGKIQKEFLNSIPGFRENSYVQNAIRRVEKYLEERHPNVVNPLESNKKADNEKNISEEKNEKELNIQMKPIPKKKRGEMSL